MNFLFKVWKVTIFTLKQDDIRIFQIFTFSVHCKCQNHHENCIFPNLEKKYLWPRRNVKEMHFRRENSNSDFLLKSFKIIEFYVIFTRFESLSWSSIVELEIVHIKQKLWFRSWWIEQKAYWEKLGPTNQSIMMKCMHNMLLLLFGSPNPQWTIIKASEASYVGLLFVISWFGRENCYFLPILLFFDLGAKIVTFLGLQK